MDINAIQQLESVLLMAKLIHATVVTAVTLAIFVTFRHATIFPVAIMDRAMSLTVKQLVNVMPDILVTCVR